MKKKIWLPIVAVLVLLALAAGGAYAFMYQPVEKAYASAMAVSQGSGTYAEKKAALEDTIQAIEGNPFAPPRIDSMTERLEQLLVDEIDRAIAADELEYAASLLEERDANRAAELRDTLVYRENQQIYAAADALEKAGKDEEALSAFRAMGDFEDASERAANIQRHLDFEAAQAIFTGTNYDEAIAALLALNTPEGQAAAEALQQEKDRWVEERRQRYAAAATLQLSAGAWHTAAVGASPWISGDARYGTPPEKADKVFSGLTSVFYIMDGKVFTTGETFGAEETIAGLTDVKKVAPGLVHALFLEENGHVTAVGSKALDRIPAKDWTDMVDVAAGAWHSVALQQDGRVVACGTNDHGQCDVTEWGEITAISAGLWHTVGLKADGTVVACGDTTYGQCDVGQWTDIVAVSCGACTTIGLKADGTVVACGDDAAGQCRVSDWGDVAAIAAGAYHTAALRLDGTVIIAGMNPGMIPATPLFSSDWSAVSVPVSEPSDLSATAYIQGVGDPLGPWLYLDPNGAVLICIDYSEPKELFRTDILATANALPSGRVTEPNASGNIIKMSTALPEIQARNNHAVLAFTGDYVGFTSNRKGVMIRNGIVYYDRGGEHETCAILPDGTLRYFRRGETSAAQLQELGVRDSFSFGPILVKDKQRAYWNDGRDLNTMRVALAYTDPYHFLAAITMRDRQVQMTFGMLSEVCVRYGCRTAYNLDGGHSTSLVFMGHELSLLTTRNVPHSNIRGLSDVIIFLQNSDVGESD